MAPVSRSAHFVHARSPRVSPIAKITVVHLPYFPHPRRSISQSLRATIAGALACAVVAASPEPASAQTPAVAFGGYRLDAWQTGSTTSALPANNVNFLAQSSDGYLWLATSAGMARFDGLRFQLITPASAPVLTGRLAYLVWPMEIAGRDTMWVATDRGMVPYANGEFGPGVTDTTFEGEAVQQLAVDGKGTVYGVTVRGSVFKLIAGRYVRIPLPGVPASDGYGIVADPDGTLWIAHDRAGLVRVHDGIITRFAKAEGIGDDHATTVFRARDGALWVGTRTGVVRYTDGAFTARTDFWGGLPTHPVYAAAETGDGAIWFATDGGGIVRVAKQKSGEYRASSFTQRDGLTDDRAIAILADRDGNVWVGTRLGLNRFHPVPFQALTTRDGLPASAMGAILLDESGKLWLAPVAGGLYSGRVVAGRAQLKTVAQAERGRVSTLARGEGGSVWAGWDRGGASNYTTSGAQRYVGAAEGVAPGSVFSIVDAPGGDLWIGTRGGLTRLAGLRSGRLSAKNFTTRDGLAENVAMRLWTHKPTDMWVGNAALSHIVGDSVKTYRVADGLAAPLITAIHTDTSGSIWVGTHGGPRACCMGSSLRFEARRDSSMNTSTRSRATGWGISGSPAHAGSRDFRSAISIPCLMPCWLGAIRSSAPRSLSERPMVYRDRISYSTPRPDLSARLMACFGSRWHGDSRLSTRREFHSTRSAPSSTSKR